MKGENRKKSRRWPIPVLVIALLIAAFLIYTGQYYRAGDVAHSMLQSSETVLVTRTDYGWLFDGPSEGDALIFYPGAKVEETAYAPLLHALAEAGRADPFLGAFPDAFDAGEWHNDMPGLTPDAAILAESDGCPRQIVRYGRYVYGFQTHMEFTRDIIAAGIEDVGGTIRRRGRFIQSAEALLAYDYTGMNRLLSAFLDAMAADYMSRRAGGGAPA